jgi:hypothetical protein
VPHLLLVLLQQVPEVHSGQGGHQEHVLACLAHLGVAVAQHLLNAAISIYQVLYRLPQAQRHLANIPHAVLVLPEVEVRAARR